MALSFYSNCSPTTLDHLNPDIGSTSLDHQSELADALLGFTDPFDPSHFLIDSLFDPPDPQYSSLSDPSVLSLPPDPFDIGIYQCPKRHRSCGDLYRPFEANSYVDGPGVSDFGIPLMEFAVPSLPPSAQSVAARERRKRISEKTQELGRLIPGGSRMNTAEMFEAAFKYVKFLQAQIGILGLLGSIQVEEQIQLLVASPTVQEKLYGDGRCLVPKEVVDALAGDQEIRSNLLISKDLDRFIKSMG